MYAWHLAKYRPGRKQANSAKRIPRLNAMFSNDYQQNWCKNVLYWSALKTSYTLWNKSWKTKIRMRTISVKYTTKDDSCWMQAAIGRIFLHASQKYYPHRISLTVSIWLKLRENKLDVCKIYVYGIIYSPTPHNMTYYTKPRLSSMLMLSWSVLLLNY